uniref:Putative cytosolic iron-sulfur protein assembly protein CIAO1 homolog n=1 Tax=Rhizophora mucronata TaxID=61149 RepID=A0A2P2KH66_RHIMU
MNPWSTVVFRFHPSNICSPYLQGKIITTGNHFVSFSIKR